MKAFFQELFEYNLHINKEILDSLAQNEKKLPDHSFALFYHVLNAHEIWNARILGEAPELEVWDQYTLEDAEQINKDNFQNSLTILEDIDLSKEVSYRNSKGGKYINTVRDVLFHVINHSTHHRAQIVVEFRRNGIDPVATDYIFFKREKSS